MNPNYMSGPKEAAGDITKNANSIKGGSGAGRNNIPSEDELNAALQEWSKMEKSLGSNRQASRFNTASIVYEDAINQALNDGASLSDLYMYTTHTTPNQFGVPKIACENCTYSFKDVIAGAFSGFSN